MTLPKTNITLKKKCLENKLLLISINFTPKTSHSCLKKWYTRFSRWFFKSKFQSFHFGSLSWPLGIWLQGLVPVGTSFSGKQPLLQLETSNLSKNMGKDKFKYRIQDQLGSNFLPFWAIFEGVKNPCLLVSLLPFTRRLHCLTTTKLRGEDVWSICSQGAVSFRLNRQRLDGIHRAGCFHEGKEGTDEAKVTFKGQKRENLKGNLSSWWLNQPL